MSEKNGPQSKIRKEEEELHRRLDREGKKKWGVGETDQNLFSPPSRHVSLVSFGRRLISYSHSHALPSGLDVSPDEIERAARRPQMHHLSVIRQAEQQRASWKGEICRVNHWGTCLL